MESRKPSRTTGDPSARGLMTIKTLSIWALLFLGSCVPLELGEAVFHALRALAVRYTPFT